MHTKLVVFLCVLLLVVGINSRWLAANDSSPLPNEFYEVMRSTKLSQAEKDNLIELSEAFYLGFKKFYEEQALNALFAHAYDLVEDEKNYVVSGKTCVFRINSNKHNPCYIHTYDRATKSTVWQHQLTKEKRPFTDYRDKIN